MYKLKGNIAQVTNCGEPDKAIASTQISDEGDVAVGDRLDLQSFFCLFVIPFVSLKEGPATASRRPGNHGTEGERPSQPQYRTIQN